MTRSNRPRHYPLIRHRTVHRFDCFGDRLTFCKTYSAPIRPVQEHLSYSMFTDYILTTIHATETEVSVCSGYSSN